ncbi:hypothetical protein FACS1894216_16320 [Synergistales bacterium]|nr:hypothetical protein FACS1894216_16320 [Synergistales bacterium]
MSKDISVESLHKIENLAAKMMDIRRFISLMDNGATISMSIGGRNGAVLEVDSGLATYRLMRDELEGNLNFKLVDLTRAMLELNGM